MCQLCSLGNYEFSGLSLSSFLTELFLMSRSSLWVNVKRTAGYSFFFGSSTNGMGKNLYNICVFLLKTISNFSETMSGLYHKQNILGESLKFSKDVQVLGICSDWMGVYFDWSVVMTHWLLNASNITLWLKANNYIHHGFHKVIFSDIN